MLVVHEASVCDVCLDAYDWPNSPPHAIPCGHIFCKNCLQNTTPSICPLCRRAYQRTHVKKLHMDPPPSETQSGPEGSDEEQLIRRVVEPGDDTIEDLVTQVDNLLRDKPSNFSKALRTSLPLLTRLRDLQSQHSRLVLSNLALSSTHNDLESSHSSLTSAHSDLQTSYMVLERTVNELRADISRMERGFAAATQEREVSKAVEERLLSRVSELEGMLHTGSAGPKAIPTPRDRKSSKSKTSRARVIFDSPPSSKGKGKYSETHNPLPSPPAPFPEAELPSFMREHLAMTTNGVAEQAIAGPSHTPLRTPSQDEIRQWEQAKNNAFASSSAAQSSLYASTSGPGSDSNIPTNGQQRHPPGETFKQASSRINRDPAQYSGHYFYAPPRPSTASAATVDSSQEHSRRSTRPRTRPRSNSASTVDSDADDLGLGLTGLPSVEPGVGSSRSRYQAPFYGNGVTPDIPQTEAEAFVHGYTQGYSQSQSHPNLQPRLHSRSQSYNPNNIYAPNPSATPGSRRSSVYYTPASPPRPALPPEMRRSQTFTGPYASNTPTPSNPDSNERPDPHRRVSFNDAPPSNPSNHRSAASTPSVRSSMTWGTPATGYMASIAYQNTARSSTGSEIMQGLRSFTTPRTYATPFQEPEDEDAIGQPVTGADNNRTPQPSWIVHPGEEGRHRDRDSRRTSSMTTSAHSTPTSNRRRDTQTPDPRLQNILSDPIRPQASHSSSYPLPSGPAQTSRTSRDRHANPSRSSHSTAQSRSRADPLAGISDSGTSSIWPYSTAGPATSQPNGVNRNPTALGNALDAANALGLNIAFDASTAWAIHSGPGSGGLAAPTPVVSSRRFLREYDSEA